MGQRLAVSEFPNDNPELHDGLVWACPSPCAPALPTLRLRKTTGGRVLGPDWERPKEPSVVEAAAEPVEAGLAESQVEASAEPIIDEVELGLAVAEVELAVARAAVAVAEVELAVAEAVVAATEAEPAVRAVEPLARAVETPFEEASPEPTEAPPSGFATFVAALSAILAERGATRAAANVAALLGQARLAPDAFDEATRKMLVQRGTLDAKTGRPTPEFSVVARAWRDARVTKIWAGSNEIMKELIGRELGF